MGENLTEILLIAAAAVCGYLLGSLNFAVIISKCFYKDDIRKHGSGNAGTTNMLRTFGKGAAAMTLLGDLLKGVAAALCFGFVLKYKGLTYVIGAATAGFFAIIGHNWPVYFNFKGGKGVLTSFAVVLTVMPVHGLCCLAIFIIAVAITKYVSLGSILGAAALPVLVAAQQTLINKNVTADGIILLIFSAIVSAMIIIRHRANIKRLCSGTESKLKFKK